MNSLAELYLAQHFGREADWLRNEALKNGDDRELNEIAYMFEELEREVWSGYFDRGLVEKYAALFVSNNVMELCHHELKITRQVGHDLNITTVNEYLAKIIEEFDEPEAAAA